MRDQELETKLRLLTLQLDNWKKLHDLITYGLDKAKPIISAEQERQFTEIRSHLLQETEHIFNRLNILGELSNDEVRRLEMDWNAVFTKLGVVQGQLKAQRKALAGQTVFRHRLNRVLGRLAPVH